MLRVHDKSCILYQCDSSLLCTFTCCTELQGNGTRKIDICYNTTYSPRSLLQIFWITEVQIVCYRDWRPFWQNRNKFFKGDTWLVLVWHLARKSIEKYIVSVPELLQSCNCIALMLSPVEESVKYKVPKNWFLCLAVPISVIFQVEVCPYTKKIARMNTNHKRGFATWVGLYYTTELVIHWHVEAKLIHIVVHWKTQNNLPQPDRAIGIIQAVATRDTNITRVEIHANWKIKTSRMHYLVVNSLYPHRQDGKTPRHVL